MLESDGADNTMQDQMPKNTLFESGSYGSLFGGPFGGETNLTGSLFQQDNQRMGNQNLLTDNDKLFGQMQGSFIEGQDEPSYFNNYGSNLSQPESMVPQSMVPQGMVP